MSFSSVTAFTLQGSRSTTCQVVFSALMVGRDIEQDSSHRAVVLRASAAVIQGCTLMHMLQGQRRRTWSRIRLQRAAQCSGHAWQQASVDSHCRKPDAGSVLEQTEPARCMQRPIRNEGLSDHEPLQAAGVSLTGSLPMALTQASKLRLVSA